MAQIAIGVGFGVLCPSLLRGRREFGRKAGSDGPTLLLQFFSLQIINKIN
jgi:hypothetical protein